MNDIRPDDDFDDLLRHAVKQSPAEPPPGFAKAIADQVAGISEADAAEGHATGVLLSLAALATAAGVIGEIDAVASRIMPILRGVPWPLLVTAAVSIGAMQLAEGWFRGRVPRA